VPLVIFSFVVNASKSLTPEELAIARGISIYYVWYEDRIHFGDDRTNFPVAICLSKEEANVELFRRNRPAAPGMDGYECIGPCLLSDEPRIEMVREVILRTRNNQPGPVYIPSDLW